MLAPLVVSSLSKLSAKPILPKPILVSNSISLTKSANFTLDTAADFSNWSTSHISYLSMKLRTQTSATQPPKTMILTLATVQ